MVLTHLNKAQQEAVINTDGPCMVIAGAGSGKTSVLAHRIAFLIQEKKVDPFNILALTFTNKAASEMRHRVEEIVGVAAKSLWLGTFHSIFLRILRKEGHLLGYSPNFSIYDTEDSKSLIKSIVKEMLLDDKTYKTNVVLGRISNVKNKLISSETYNKNDFYRLDDEKEKKPFLGEIYQKYTDRCFRSGVMDFDDLLINTHRLFNQHLDVLYRYQEKFKFVLVDEYQDTNKAQCAILQDLCGIYKNICVVGDDSQSIYAFRGADINNILDFEKHYPNLITIRLEQNYRSTRNIVSAANSIIEHNKNQLKKSIWTNNGYGELISLIKADSDVEEARIVARSICENKTKDNLKNSSFVILYRTNNQSRTFEEELRKANLPYRIVGGMSFYQRKEVKDLIAYLRLLVNQADEEALKRIINLPKRGIGITALDKMVAIAVDHSISLWNVVANANSFLDGRLAGSVSAFANMIMHANSELETLDAFTISSNIANRSGLLKELIEDKTQEGVSRYENVQELLSAIKEFTTNAENEDISLGAFLQNITLVTNAEEDTGELDRITLMTIHSAKGLEFDYVYIAGMEEGIFPSQLMTWSRDDIEEERRLFYVATTRAKKKLTLLHSASRYRYGQLQYHEPSRFIKEIDASCVQNTQISKNASAFFASQNLGTKGLRSISQNASANLLDNTSHTLNDKSNFSTNGPLDFQIGMQVEHPKFRIGTILQVDSSGKLPKIVVNFPKFGDKTLLSTFAKLKILNIR